MKQEVEALSRHLGLRCPACRENLQLQLDPWGDLLATSGMRCRSCRHAGPIAAFSSMRLRETCEVFYVATLADDTRAYLVLLGRDGLPVASLEAHDWGVEGRDAPGAWLTWLHVAPNARRMGWGRRLIERAAEHARKAGKTALTLCVNRSNTPAVQLYEACGFVRFHGDGDQYWMRLDLCTDVPIAAPEKAGSAV